MTLNKHTIRFYVIMSVSITGVALVKIEVNAKFVCVKEVVAIFCLNLNSQFRSSAGPRQRQQYYFSPYAASSIRIQLLSPEIKSYRRENQDENEALNSQVILYWFCFSTLDPAGNKIGESNPFPTRSEIMKNHDQSFLYQFGLKHRNKYFLYF